MDTPIKPDMHGVCGAGTAHMFWSGASAIMTSAQKIQSVYAKIDKQGMGNVTRQQFEESFKQFNPPAAFKQMGASAIFSQIDPAAAGVVSREAFVNGIVAMMGEVRQSKVNRVEGKQERKAATPASTIGLSLQALHDVLDQAGSRSPDDEDFIRRSP